MEENATNLNFKMMETHLMQFGGGEIFISQEYWDEGIAIIYLNHPEKRNAISGKMMVDFHNCVSHLEKWRVGKAVLLCGLGVNFCSGGDLDFARATGTAEEGFYMSSFMQEVLKKFRKLPLVSVTLIHGPALGGGAEISVFSDLILVTDDVKFGFVHGKMGLITAFGGTTRLFQILGERKCLEMLLTGKIYNAEECVSIGLASKIVTTSNRIEEALQFVRQFTVHHSSIVQKFKQVLTKASSESFENALSFESRLFAPTWGSDLNLEALKSHVKHVQK